MQTTEEEWRPIPGFDGYRASTAGRVSNRHGRVLTGTLNKRGHQQVNVRGRYRRMTVAAHRLIAIAFLGPPPSGHIALHLNGNKLDNRPVNLVWAPRSQLIRQVAHLLGEANPNAKLTTEKVRQMRVLRQQGMSLAELGRRFGVTERAAHRVVTRRDWKHIE